MVRSSLKSWYLFTWTELRQSPLRRDIFEDQSHGHPYSDFLPRTLDHVANHRYLIVSIVESDMRYDIRHVALESRNRHIMHDRERIHGAGFAELGPLEFPGIAMRAESLGRPAKLSTVTAARRRKLWRFPSVP